MSAKIPTARKVGATDAASQAVLFDLATGKVTAATVTSLVKRGEDWEVVTAFGALRFIEDGGKQDALATLLGIGTGTVSRRLVTGRLVERIGSQHYTVSLGQSIRNFVQYADNAKQRDDALKAAGADKSTEGPAFAKALVIASKAVQAAALAKRQAKRDAETAAQAAAGTSADGTPAVPSEAAPEPKTFAEQVAAVSPMLAPLVKAMRDNAGEVTDADLASILAGQIGRVYRQAVTLADGRKAAREAAALPTSDKPKATRTRKAVAA